MTNDNLELEPPKKVDIRKIEELDDNIDHYDNDLDIVTQIVNQRLTELEEQNSSESETEEMSESSIEQEQERLKQQFGEKGRKSKMKGYRIHDSYGGTKNIDSENEELSENDDEISQIQKDLAKRIFNN